MHMIEDVLNATFSRRDFLKGAVAATAAAAGLGIVGGSENRLSAAAEGTAPAGAPAVNDAAEGGTWYSAPCWHNCVASCMMRALKFGPVEELKEKYGADLVTELPCFPDGGTDPNFYINPSRFAQAEDFTEKNP